MKAWGWMMGGLIVWAIHFLGVYVISSVGDVVATADDPLWRMAALAFSGLCALASAALLWLAARRLRATRGPRFQDQMAAFGAAISFVAICWQAIPTVIGY